MGGGQVRGVSWLFALQQDGWWRGLQGKLSLRWNDAFLNPTGRSSPAAGSFWIADFGKEANEFPIDMDGLFSLQDPKIRAFVFRLNASETNEFPKRVFLSLLSQDAARTQTRPHCGSFCAAVTGRLEAVIKLSYLLRIFNDPSSQHNSLILHYNPETNAADTRQRQDIFMPSFLYIHHNTFWNTFLF